VITTLRPSNQISIPSQLTAKLGWQVGDGLDLAEDQGRIVISRRPLDREPASMTADEALRGWRPLKMAEGWSVADLLAGDREGGW
jgi:bifunctional DNA-binding transcriptional regulator/antitoxin component of YhaV-PrlF toxin-antitoxin module